MLDFIAILIFFKLIPFQGVLYIVQLTEMTLSVNTKPQNLSRIQISQGLACFQGGNIVYISGAEFGALK